MYVHQNNYTAMFIATLFIVAPNWKQLKYLLAANWIKKLQYFHTKEYNHPTYC